VTFPVMLAVVLFGNHWWKADAASYSENIYKPLEMRTDGTVFAHIHPTGTVAMAAFIDRNFCPDDEPWRDCDAVRVGRSVICLKTSQNQFVP
jgi:hypothetical protein